MVFLKKKLFYHRYDYIFRVFITKNDVHICAYTFVRNLKFLHQYGYYLSNVGITIVLYTRTPLVEKKKKFTSIRTGF